MGERKGWKWRWLSIRVFASTTAFTAEVGHVVCKLPWLHMVMVGLAVAFAQVRACSPLVLVLNQVAWYKV